MRTYFKRTPIEIGNLQILAVFSAVEKGQIVDPVVARQLRVERRSDDGTVPDCDRAVVPGSQYLDVASLADCGRADEHGVKGAVEAVHVERGLEAVLLAAEGVALDGHVEQIEGLDAVVAGVTGRHDQPGTGCQHRLAGRDVVADLRGDAFLAQQPGDRRRLPPGNQQDVTLGDDPGLAYLDDLDSLVVGVRGRLEGACVFTHVALDGDHAGGTRHVGV